MALQSYNTTIIHAGVIADLGVAHDAYVGPNGFLSSTDDIAIYGTGSGHEVTVRGTVVGHMGGVTLGDSMTSDTGQFVKVVDGGEVTANLYNGVVVYGTDSVVENHGTITGGFGITMLGQGDGTMSTLLNTGKIIATGAMYDAVNRNGDEAFQFINKGLVKAASGVAYDGSDPNSVQTLINSGKMVGDVLFGTGNDIYRGADGKVVGSVSGDAGDDILIGGKKAEQLAGDAGRDQLTGGKGGDTFVFHLLNDTTVAEAGRDIIRDFNHAQGDRIDLSELDAVIGGADDQFTFIGKDDFSNTPGELRYYFSGNKTFIEGTVDADGTADFMIELKGKINLTEADFVL